MRRATAGAAIYAAPDTGSDQRRNGTQDVNDPASGPAMRPEGRSGSFTSWVPRVAIIELMNWAIAARFRSVAPAGNLAESTCVLNTQNANRDRTLARVYVAWHPTR